MKVTTWSPDTCECTIDYEWDETLAGEDRTHAYNRTRTTCQDHTGVTKSELLDTLNSENQRKNITKEWVLQNIPDVKRTIVDQTTGDSTEDFKSGMEFEWSFTGKGKNRILHAGIKGKALSELEKTSIQDYGNSEFGTNKVMVD